MVSGNWTAVPAFPNLRFTNAVGLTAIPGTNLLCVWEREGRMWTFVNTSNVAQKKLVLDISNQCQGWDDSGLLGVAFHPGFATNHYVFIYYTWVVPGTVVGDAYTRPPTYSTGTYHDRLVRYMMDTNGVLATNSETIFVDQVGDSVWHNGGGMFFHPTNGFLYWTDGDDAIGSNTQIITNNILSGVFRIDVDKRGGNISHAPPRQPANGTTANYYIPNDNPFVGQSNVLEEFFCLGLRSPHRMTEDPGTGRIFIGDVGLSTKEEVDIIEPGESGLNFQWDTIEGIGGDLTPPYVGISRQPVIDYLHTDGNFAVIGGYVYHGSQFASDLAGKYIFGDNGSDNVWVLDESTTPAGKVILCTVPKGAGYNSGNDYTGLSSFGVDAAGEIYMCVMGNLGSPLYTLSRSGPTNTLNPPPLFSQLGAFTNLATLAPGPALVPYTVNSPLWSDAAVKSRWIALPTNTFISFYPTGEWSFPAGTVFFKNFDLVTNENTAQRRRLETRLLVRDTNGTVYGASYKWRPDNSDADIVTFSTNENILITTATGVRTQQWFYPGRSDCLRCHTPAAGGVLGLKTRQLNGTNQYPSGVTDNQLRTLNHLGFFTPTQTESVITNYPKLVSVSDTNASLELRARSYFDANCSHCHRPGGVDALFDMRFDTPLPSQNLLNGYAINSLGINGAKIIKPGYTNASVLYQRDSSLGTIQMPPLAKNLVDTNAMAVIATWINSLPQGSTLPPPWSDTDLGLPLAGSATYTNGEFDVTASGSDIGGNADTGHFAFQPINGSGQIIARVIDVQYTDPWAKAGVMFRESLGTDSRNVLMQATGGNGIGMQWRTNTGDVTSYVPGPDFSTPYWVKIVRSGDVFTSYSSPNAVDWTVTGSVTNVMSSMIEVGLVACSRQPTL
ncbi:MAG TPA: PQQ-dependent sugar dehydrogenase, partial [Candidatus Acidoferrales bacterium]|nr:PQQ-dependent sugar dehydrogenase [Candidatus Acidoferrales bacterium]